MAALSTLLLFWTSGILYYPLHVLIQCTAQLNIRSQPLSLLISTPPPLTPLKGGWRSRGLSVSDRDLLPEPADAEGRQEPSARLRRPLPGVRGGAFAQRGGGAWSSPRTDGGRGQRLRGIG